jgi:uncharacterized protein with GYD domain
MATYLTQFSYTAEAWAALSKNPTDRREGLRKLFEGVGGRLIELYYCFGEYDGVLIYEAPDDQAAAAVLIAAISPGHVKGLSTTRLISVEDMVAALGKAGGMTYSAPRG